MTLNPARLLILAAVVAAGLAGTAAAAHASTTINFDDGTGGNPVDSSYSALGVIFSGATFTGNFGLPGSSGSLGIYSTVRGYQFGPDTPILGQFTSAVSSVTIRGIDAGQAGIALDAYDAADALLGYAEFFGAGAGVGTFHDLTVSAPGIAGFRVYQPLTTNGFNGFGDGLVFDDLSFVQATAVPEPASWALMLAGIAGIAAAWRRRPSAA